jgi:uncharacterized protein YbaR (Trm112 family)
MSHCLFAVPAGNRGQFATMPRLHRRWAGILGFRGAFMISKELLDILRCPLDPTRSARLDQEADGLVCQRCRLKYPIKEGLPCMLVEEAILPPGVGSLQALPCQQAPVAEGTPK